MTFREEKDLLGPCDVPADALWGVHTQRAMENFPLAGRPVHRGLVHAYGAVKLAAAQTNHELGRWDEATFAAIETACREMIDGQLDRHVVVDALQGGAGTSTNMNVNEVLANRALEILGRPLGDYQTLSPLDDVNLHQSTNDTYPTALRVAGIYGLRRLEPKIVALQEAFQEKEKQFAHVVKIGRTEMQDAVLMTLGREMGAYAEAIGRDRWRVYKCEERLRVVNLGGTATATALVDRLGYTRVSQLVSASMADGKTIRQAAIDQGLLTAEEFDQLVSPEQVTRLGAADAKHQPEG
jgi:aspartate ammonia-lyase